MAVHICVDLFLDSILFISLFVFMPILHCFDYCSFLVHLKSVHISPSLLFYFTAVLALWGPLRFHMNFRISLSNFFNQKACWDLSWDWVESIDEFWGELTSLKHRVFWLVKKVSLCLLGLLSYLWALPVVFRGQVLHNFY